MRIFLEQQHSYAPHGILFISAVLCLVSLAIYNAARFSRGHEDLIEKMMKWAGNLCNSIIAKKEGKRADEPSRLKIQLHELWRSSWMVRIGSCWICLFFCCLPHFLVSVKSNCTTYPYCLASILSEHLANEEEPFKMPFPRSLMGSMRLPNVKSTLFKTCAAPQALILSSGDQAPYFIESADSSRSLEEIIEWLGSRQDRWRR